MTSLLGDKAELLAAYQNSRKAVSQEIFSIEQSKWNKVVDEGSKKLWEKIDWKGNLNGQNTQAPAFEDLTSNFEALYKAPLEEIEKLDELVTDKYVPYS